jgi:hypothetical protein
MANGSKKIDAATTRIEPTSPGAYTVKPRFIRINDVPQIRDNAIRSTIALPF